VQIFFKTKDETVKKTKLVNCGYYQQNNAAAVKPSYLGAQSTAKAEENIFYF
jgi:hypothetical protein